MYGRTERRQRAITADSFLTIIERQIRMRELCLNASQQCRVALRRDRAGCSAVQRKPDADQLQYANAVICVFPALPMRQVHWVDELRYDPAIESKLMSAWQPPLITDFPAGQVATRVFAPPTDVLGPF